jgi:hypothetical protein
MIASPHYSDRKANTSITATKPIKRKLGDFVHASVGGFLSIRDMKPFKPT